ncbi:MAG: hypothetical protein U0271_45350 [Polyangiaceae bacterium]
MKSYVTPGLLSVLALSGLTVTGCVASISGAAGPTIDTGGHPGGEGRLEVLAGVGSPKARVYAAAAVGGGYSSQREAGYGFVSPELGFDFGDSPRGSVGVYYEPRFYAVDRDITQHSVGVAGQVLVPVGERGGEHSTIALGPRLSTEAQFDSSGDAQGSFGLGLVVRWIAFDSTHNTWGF